MKMLNFYQSLNHLQFEEFVTPSQKNPKKVILEIVRHWNDCLFLQSQYCHAEKCQHDLQWTIPLVSSSVLKDGELSQRSQSLLRYSHTEGGSLLRTGAVRESLSSQRYTEGPGGTPPSQGPAAVSVAWFPFEKNQGWGWKTNHAFEAGSAWGRGDEAQAAAVSFCSVF